MTAPDNDREQRLADLLADYEAQMAAGGFGTPQGEVRSAVDTLEESHRLQSAKACLLRLERIWPHGKPLDDELPRTIDRFEVISELGRGGFGIVYLARDAKMGRLVALKVQRPETLLSASLRQRFVREARAAARLSHPHIAGVYEVGEAGMRVWIASEHVAGDSLSAWLRDNRDPVAPKTAARLVADLADALTCAHRLGVLHRDLKPSNVLLQRIANSERAAGGDDAARVPTSREPDIRAHDLCAYAPKLIDFGLAKLDEGPRHETRTGALIGTPPYMAPEQAAGQTQAIGPATDVYGLGTILYELVTRRPPFRGENDVQTLRHVLDDDPLHPRKLRSDLPADLAAITLKCLEKQPAARYASTGELAADLERFLSDRPTIARPLSIPQRVAKWSRRRPAVAALVAVSMLAAATFVAGNAAYIRQLQTARHTADALRSQAETSAAAATEQEDLAQRYLYASRMRLAYELLAQGDAVRAGQLLDPYKPPSAQADRRGFEWYHLTRRLHPERLSLTGHTGQVYGVAFSPDARTVASGGQDGLVKLWDAVSGRELSTLAGHQACVNCLAFSPDGQLLVSVSCDHTIKLWDPQSHELLATLEGHPGEIHSLAFSPNGRHLATGGQGPNAPVVRVWDSATQEILATYQPRGMNVDYLAWLDDQILVFADHYTYEPEQQVLWNFQTDETRHVNHGARSIAVSADRRDVLLGDSNGTIFSVPELSDHMVRAHGPRHMAWSLGFSPSGKWLAAGFDDATVRVWNWPEMNRREVLPCHAARPQTVTFAPRGEQLASAHWDGTIKLWSLAFESVPKVQSTCVDLEVVGCASLVVTSDDFRYVALPDRSDQVTVFALDTGLPIAQLAVDHRTAGLRFDRDDPNVLFGYTPDSGRFWKWNWRGGQCEIIAALPVGSHGPYWISSDGVQLFYAQQDPEPVFTIYDAQHDNWWQQRREGSLRGLAVSPTNDVWAVTRGVGSPGYQSSHAEVLGINARKVLCESTETVLAVGNQGRLIAEEDGPHGVSIVDTRNDQLLCHVKHDDPHTSVAISPDDRTLATGDAIGHVMLWNLATGSPISRLETDGTPIVHLWFSPDGRQLAALAGNNPENPASGIREVRLFIFAGDDRP